MTHHYAACPPCCDGPPRGPLACDDLPTSLLVAWSGAFEVLFGKCGDCSGLYIAGGVSAPSAASANPTLISTPPTCAYGPGASVDQVNTVDQRTCDPDESVGSCTITTQVTIGPPVANASGPFAGYWTVTVSMDFIASTCDGAAYACACPFFTDQSVTFVGPPTWQTPIGSYSPAAGSSWSGAFFPCDGASIVSEILGSVTVS